MKSLKPIFKVLFYCVIAITLLILSGAIGYNYLYKEIKKEEAIKKCWNDNKENGNTYQDKFTRCMNEKGFIPEAPSIEVDNSCSTY